MVLVRFSCSHSQLWRFIIGAIFTWIYLCRRGSHGVRLTIGNDIEPSGNSINQAGNLFLFENARVPEIANNGTALLLSIHGHFLNLNPTTLHIWRRDQSVDNNWYLRLVHTYEFRSSIGNGLDTISIYKEDSPECILLESGDIMGIFITETPSALSFVTSSSTPQTIRHFFSNESHFPVTGSRLQFDTLFFPFQFSIQVQIDVGEEINGTYTGVTCDEFDDIVQNFLDMTTAGQETTTMDFKGESGATGATGPAGPPGFNGTQGIKGELGDAGPPGATGPMGPVGPIGEPGIGQKGEPGTSGEKGDRGDVGLLGATGSIGATGLTGEKGDRGLQGILGLPGGVGATGERGLQGDGGTHGVSGDDGATGRRGPKGDTGDVGSAGPRGPPGTANNNSLPKYSGSSSNNNDSLLLQDYVIIIIIVWNVVITLLIIAIYVRKLCRYCRNGNNKIGHSDPDFTDPYHPDNKDNLVKQGGERHRPSNKRTNDVSYNNRNYSEA